jgi:hypothetical protein
MQERLFEKQTVAQIVKENLSFWKLNIFHPVCQSPITVATISTAVWPQLHALKAIF